MLLTVLGLFLLFSCDQHPEQSAAIQPTGDSLYLSLAKGFSVKAIETGFEVCFANKSLRDLPPTVFSFAKNGQENAIQTPLERIACLSTTHASYLADLGLTDKIVGIGYAEEVIDPRLKSLIDSGKIQNITNASGVDLEKLVALNPDAFLVYSYDYAPNDLIEKAGIAIIHINEYEEQEPLARAEWLKLFGILGGCKERADSLFRTVQSQYETQKLEVFTMSFVPSVVTASYYGGQWYVPGSGSFAAKLIHDAGGVYLFHHKEGEGNVAVSFEELYAAAAQADFFGKVAATNDESRQAFFEGDKRFESLNCFVKNQLFLCNTRTADYFGRASSEPHVLLADLIYLFHPGALPNHQSVYFKQTLP